MCIAHEYRHAFQIYWAELMDDNIAKIWRKEIITAKNSSNTIMHDRKDLERYNLQAIEVDAEAFAIYYLRTYKIFI